MVINRRFVISILSIIIESKEDGNMRKSKFYVNLTTTERNLLLTCLNDLRNDLLSKGKYPDAVDDLISKFAKAKLRKLEII